MALDNAKIFAKKFFEDEKFLEEFYKRGGLITEKHTRF